MGLFSKSKGTVDYSMKEHGRHVSAPPKDAPPESTAKTRDGQGVGDKPDDKRERVKLFILLGLLSIPLLYFFPILIPVVLLGALWYFLFYSIHHTWQFKKIAHRTSGEIIEFEVRRGKKSNIYYPVVRFLAPDGQYITFTSNTGSNWQSRFKTEVEVLFHPEDYSRAKINSLYQLWGVAFILSIFTIPGTIIFGYILVDYAAKALGWQA